MKMKLKILIPAALVALGVAVIVFMMLSKGKETENNIILHEHHLRPGGSAWEEYAFTAMVAAEQTDVITIPEPVSQNEFRILPIPLSPELQRYSYQVCLENDIEYALLMALMWQESKFDPNLVSHNTNGTYDSGLMQINSCHKDWLRSHWGITDLFDPKDNIRVGAAMFAARLDKYSEHLALMAYQYGETGMRRQVGKGVTETKITERILQKRDEYRELLG